MDIIYLIINYINSTRANGEKIARVQRPKTAWVRAAGNTGPFFRHAAGLLTLAPAPRKAYSINMTKQLMTLASRMRRAFIRSVEQDIRKEEMRAVSVQEQIIFLSEEEAAFVALETRRLLRAQRQEARRKKRMGVPPPPTPGKIAYAVYM